jgi:hypothetical protein
MPSNLWEDMQAHKCSHGCAVFRVLKLESCQSAARSRPMGHNLQVLVEKYRSRSAPLLYFQEKNGDYNYLRNNFASVDLLKLRARQIRSLGT